MSPMSNADLVIQLLRVLLEHLFSDHTEVFFVGVFASANCAETWPQTTVGIRRRLYFISPKWDLLANSDYTIANQAAKIETQNLSSYYPVTDYGMLCQYSWVLTTEGTEWTLLPSILWTRRGKVQIIRGGCSQNRWVYQAVVPISTLFKYINSWTASLKGILQDVWRVESRIIFSTSMLRERLMTLFVIKLLYYTYNTLPQHASSHLSCAYRPVSPS